MEKILDLRGKWQLKGEGLSHCEVYLPGTLDTNQVGHKDTPELATRLTRLHTWEGNAWYSREIGLPSAEGGRLLLKVERTRKLALFIDGKEIEVFEQGSLSTPYMFEITDFAGRLVKMEFSVDNKYTGWPVDSILASSAATDETQTNWNGILGDFSIYRTGKTFLSSLRFYPMKDSVLVRGEVSSTEKIGKNWTLCLCSEAFLGKVVMFSLGGMKFEQEIPLKASCRKWDEEEGNVYTVHAQLLAGEQLLDQRKEIFGIRIFGVDEGLRLTLNGRRFFLRGEANCCVFPEEGHPPMTEAEWEKVLKIYASYGVNCMRFHSWCPPEAAFRAADQLGMMIQPELSHWNCKDAFQDEEARSYYQMELRGILRQFANHPSFVMLTFGNELQYTEEGFVWAGKLLDEARAYDSTRLYANSSNYHYGELGTDAKSDFYTSAAMREQMLRATSSPMIGHLNEKYPSARQDYSAAVVQVHAEGKPVFGFEVGQYEILPEFGEISEFQGVTRAVNLEIVRSQVEKSGIGDQWEKYIEATGELSLLAYREEVEACLRTEGMSGLSLLGLQDFPGQGTAIVGMLNSHLKTKPYDFAKPERFQAFFTAVLPLLYLPQYTYTKGEELTAEFRLANYGKTDLHKESGWRLLKGMEVVMEEHFSEKDYPQGKLSSAGEISITFTRIGRLDLEVYVGEYRNSYPLWVYPEESEELSERVLQVETLTESLVEKIENGAIVFLEPEPTKENFPNSIKGQFTTDFWSVGTFPVQPGGMGILVDPEHPAFAGFPTENHSNYQWWPMACGRPMILPKYLEPVITVPDCYSRLRHMGLLFAARLGEGVIAVSSMGLSGKKQYPECRALRRSILTWLNEGCVDVVQIISRKELCEIVANMKKIIE